MCVAAVAHTHPSLFFPRLASRSACIRGSLSVGSGSVSGAANVAVRWFGCERDRKDRKPRGENASCLGWEPGRGEGVRGEVERRRRRGEPDVSFRLTGWGIVPGQLWWGQRTAAFVPKRRRKGQRSGTAPLHSVSLLPFGGVQSSRASRATRTRLFYVLGSVKDSLSASDASTFSRVLSRPRIVRRRSNNPVKNGG